MLVVFCLQWYLWGECELIHALRISFWSERQQRFGSCPDDDENDEDYNDDNDGGQWLEWCCIRWQVTHIDHSVRDLGGPLKTCHVLTNTQPWDKDWMRKTHTLGRDKGIFGGNTGPERHPASHMRTHLWTDQRKIVSSIIWDQWTENGWRVSLRNIEREYLGEYWALKNILSQKTRIV